VLSLTISPLPADVVYRSIALLLLVGLFGLTACDSADTDRSATGQATIRITGVYAQTLEGASAFDTAEWWGPDRVQLSLALTANSELDEQVTITVHGAVPLNVGTHDLVPHGWEATTLSASMEIRHDNFRAVVRGTTGSLRIDRWTDKRLSGTLSFDGAWDPPYAGQASVQATFDAARAPLLPVFD